ncbi:MAG: hypothetical protein H0U75_02305 [Legionella sp.]|nr:hypothetical protein [Legionella sp.]
MFSKIEKNIQNLVNLQYDFFRTDCSTTRQINTDSKRNFYDLSKDYLFLLENNAQILIEFDSLLKALMHHKVNKNKKFWLYTYYLASLLESFYTGYKNKSEQEKYIKLKETIKRFLNENEADNIKNAEQKKIWALMWMESVASDILKGIHHVITCPAHTSKMREYLGYVNMWRIYWIFGKMSITSTFATAPVIDLINQFDDYFKVDSSLYMQQVKDLFDASKPIFNFLSVALFGARFFLETVVTLRHTFLPTNIERDANTSKTDRFLFEAKKRHPVEGNDSVWGPFNYLCNIILKGSPLADQLTAVVLLFDIAMIYWRYTWAENEYKLAKIGIESLIGVYANQACEFKVDKDFSNPCPSIKEITLRAQLKTLDIERDANKQTFMFVGAAALLLAMGFTACILITPVGFSLVCTLAVAMYRTSDSFKAYSEKSITLNTMEFSSKLERQIAIKHNDLAMNDFYYTLARNALMPLLLVSSFAVFPPLCIALTLLFVTVEVSRSALKHRANVDIKKDESEFSQSLIQAAM